ncbi:hypothetical protein [Agrobacterium vitis]|uniref:Uncharacterized protein n=1 Tax=Agrobacterium vitis TaxID=373 RepID=A0AAE5AVF5_AGRVI|nr:hypothetical protein [Agrobacterium vitis]MUZ57022.1 hypothetical protein [Agrobacterium vitis]
MAYISHSSPSRLFTSSIVLAESALHAISMWFSQIESWRQHRAMEKALAEAPFDMRKDLAGLHTTRGRPVATWFKPPKKAAPGLAFPDIQAK